MPVASATAERLQAWLTPRNRHHLGYRGLKPTARFICRYAAAATRQASAWRSQGESLLHGHERARGKSEDFPLTVNDPNLTRERTLDESHRNKRSTADFVDD